MIFLIIFFLLQFPVKEKPKNWPWKGVNISSFQGQIDGDDFKVLKEKGANFVRIVLKINLDISLIFILCILSEATLTHCFEKCTV